RAMAWGGIVSCLEDNGSYERGWLLGFRQQSFCFALSTQGAGRLTYLTAPMTFRPGRWYHLVGVYDGKSQRLYVNGQLVKEASEQSGAILYHPTHRFAVGAYKDENEDFRMHGAIHEVLIHEQALSSKVIAKRYKDRRGILPEPEGGSFTGVSLSTVPPLAELQPRINTAIDRGVESLLLAQNRDGSWGYVIDRYRNGATALALLALVEAGLDHQHPAIEAALEFLSAHDPDRVYSFGCQLLALGALGDTKHRTWARRLVSRFLDMESDGQEGGWAYPSGSVDISNTQFAALGFFGASQLGVEIPASTWRRMAAGTIEHHQPVVQQIPWEDATRTGKREIAGFTYFKGGRSYEPSGSMTTAGLCVLALAERLAGKKLGREVERKIERSKQRALGWLTENFSASTNPGYPSTTYYYLYGLERVGAFLDIETFGGRPWYREGAHWLVGQQASDGGWKRHDQTCFALLFLTKATAPTTGPQISRKASSWVTSKGDVRLHAVGRSAFSIWVEASPELAKEQPRVAEVHYFLDGAEIAVLPGRRDKVWGSDAYLLQHRFEQPGAHEFRAEVVVVDKAGKSRRLESEGLSVQATRDPRVWMAKNLTSRGKNLLTVVKVSASSSSAQETHGADMAIDGREATPWLCAPEDAHPSLKVSLDKSVRADRLWLSPADSNLLAQGHHDQITGIEVVVNGRFKIEAKVSIEDPLLPITVLLGKKLRISDVEIKITDRRPGSFSPGVVGFSEIRLQLGK
ncbi:MAG: hypothetical protein QF412_13090, partial [Planctomycetota bacterium]|nr:hypothetical protein [Planctomycetota bacterium]